ncbi:MAG: hypothetical protein JF616_03470 [Fibrobacteres bacterium]|nr:hypothetical protein [Fibrobacterota bacterium]
MEIPRLLRLMPVVLALAASAYPLEIQVTYSAEGKNAQVQVLHTPDREPLAALRFRLRLKPSAGVQSLAVAKPETGPWAQFLPRAALDGQAVTAFAMAPATGIGRDSSGRLIARFDLVLSSPGSVAADLIDSVAVVEAYGPDGKPLTLQTSLTTSLARRAPAPRASFRQRGNARTLTFNLGRPARVRAWVSDMRGRRIASVLDRKLPAGIQEATWNGNGPGGRPPAPGAYLFHLEAGTFSYDRKLEVAP